MLCTALKFCHLVNTKLIFSSEEQVKAEEKKEQSCVKIEDGIAPEHGLVGVFFGLNYLILLQCILK